LETQHNIVEHYPLFRSDLESLISDKAVPLILIKANICRILEPKLKQDGFNVLNHDLVVPFPAAGRQTEFHRQFDKIGNRPGFDICCSPSSWM